MKKQNKTVKCITAVKDAERFLKKNNNIMKDADFSLEYEMDDNELYRFNCGYFKRMYGEKIKVLFLLGLLPFVLLSINSIGSESDFIKWIVLNLGVVLLFVMLQPLFVRLICVIIVNDDSRFEEYDKILGSYKYEFNESKICVDSPVGFFTHKWNQLDKVVLTKEYLLLYIDKKKGYIISRSESKCKNNRKMNDLICMVENNVCNVVKM